MKKILSFGFLLMGFSFTVTQGLLIRELLVAFFGNELSIGLILGNWLILEAVGSGLLGRLADRWQGKAPSFAALQVLFALFSPHLARGFAFTGRLNLWTQLAHHRMCPAFPNGRESDRKGERGLS
jgi:MFS family permease